MHTLYDSNVKLSGQVELIKITLDSIPMFHACAKISHELLIAFEFSELRIELGVTYVSPKYETIGKVCEF